MNCAMVTGCMGGIGYAVTQTLLNDGYFVVGMGTSAAEKKQEQIAALGENFLYVSGNVANAADRAAFLQTALQTGIRLQVLVNTAGVAPSVRRDLLDMTEESYDRVMDINLKGAVFLTQAVANEMRKNDLLDGVRGRIVSISSCSAYTSSVSRGEYCLSKAAMTMMTLLFADRLAQEGITVNEVCPGIIATDMTAPVQEKYDKLIADGLVPMQRWGTPDDIAKAVKTLYDGSLGFTTGQSIIADGGLHIRKL
ncbi:MAG: 3-ketoacyl-ACP reductase [Clostridia bacterium]|nr:3-ketoacyl-ACP reductase [Clostridia bacterium]